MTTETLSGIELRKAVCEALGWTRGNRFWHHPNCELIQDCVAECGIRDDEQLPKYESDATLFFELLDKVCTEKGWLWSVGNSPRNDNKGLWCEIAGPSPEPLLHVWIYGSTLTEAGCRCLLAALRDKGE